MESMTYDEAVAYVLREQGAAYTFIPDLRAGKTVGGKIYALAYNEEHESEPDEYPEFNVFYSGGLFRSSSGEGEVYLPEEVPQEAKIVNYLPTSPEAAYENEMMLDYYLRRLQGMSDEQAKAGL